MWLDVIYDVTHYSTLALESCYPRVTVSIRYRPLHGSTYVPTPAFLAAKHCILNIQNRDSKCFLWSVLSALHEPKINKNRLSNYTKYESTLDMSGINYPVETTTRDIPKLSTSIMCPGSVVIALHKSTNIALLLPYTAAKTS